MSEKLQKILARAGHGSRRNVETLLVQGRVSVDEKIAMLGDRVDVTVTNNIRVDGRLISIKPLADSLCRVLAYYKREGELCTRIDPKGRPTVFDRLPRLNFSRWIIVGRLDINTSGLLLFTTDGELAHRLMHPSCKIEREYAVRVCGKVDVDKLHQLTCGIQLKDGLAAFRRLTFQGGEKLNQWYNVTLTEGRNREVRRLWEAVKMRVSRLIRVRYGNIILPKWLPRGGWTELQIEEINALRKKVQLTPEAVTKLPIQCDRRRLKKNPTLCAGRRNRPNTVTFSDE